MNKNTITILLFALLMGVISANAQISGAESFSGDCFGDPVMAKYTIKNTFSSTAEFTLTLEDAENNFDYYIVPEKITLEPGKQGTFYLFIKPCCWTKPGTYILTLKASSSIGTYTKKITFEVKETREVVLRMEKESVTLGQCEEATVKIFIENRSPVKETVMLSIESDYNDIGLSAQEITLDANTAKEVELTIKAPCKTTIKSFDVKVIGKIKGTEITNETSLKVYFIDKQVVEILTDSIEACNDIDQTKEIIVRNAGRAKDVLSVTLDAPEWVQLIDKEIQIDANSEAAIKVNILRSDANEGSYTINVKLSSKIYSKDTNKAIELKLKDCYRIIVSDISGKEKACIEEGKLKYKFRVKNESEEKVSLTASVSGIKAEVTPESLELDVGEEATVEAIVDASNETPGTKELKLKLASEKFTIEHFREFTLEDCYALSIDAAEFKEGATLEVSPQLCPQSALIEVKVTNIGTKKQRVTAKLEGPEWVYLEPKKLYLDPQESDSYYIYVSPAATEKAGNYTAELTIKAEDFEETYKMPIALKAVTLPEKIDITAEQEYAETIVEEKRTVKAKMRFKNTSSCMLEVKSIKSLTYDANFSPSEFTLDINKDIAIDVTVILPKDFNENYLELPVLITTDRGDIRKTIRIQLIAEEETPVEEVTITPEETPTETVPEATVTTTPPTGKAVLAAPWNLIIIGIIALAIIIGAYYKYASTSKRPGRRRR